MGGRGTLAALGFLVAASCGNGEATAPAGKADETVGEDAAQEFASVEEMELELETLDNEIRGLEEFLAANAGWSSPDPADPDPRAILEAARGTREAAAVALAAADTARAADSLRAAGARIEHAKRLLGVAEEIGIDFEPAADTLPAGDTLPPVE